MTREDKLRVWEDFTRELVPCVYVVAFGLEEFGAEPRAVFHSMIEALKHGASLLPHEGWNHVDAPVRQWWFGAIGHEVWVTEFKLR